VIEVIPTGYQGFLQKIKNFLEWFSQWDIKKQSAKGIEPWRNQISAPKGYEPFLDAFWHKAELYTDVGNRAMMEEIRTYSNKKELLFKDGKLEHLPPEIGQCQYLESLNLSGNKLQYLPDNLEELQHLVKLDLSDNQFRVFPEILAKFKGRLFELNFSKNPLKLSKNKAEKYSEVEELIEEGLNSIIHNQTQVVQVLICRDDLENAFKKFNDILNNQKPLPKDLIRQLTLLESRFSANKRAIQMDIDSVKNLQTVKNQITSALLGLLDDFESWAKDRT